MQKIRIPPFWFLMSLVSGLINILVMTLHQPTGTILSFVIGWSIYILVCPRKNNGKKRNLLLAAMLTSFITYLGLTMLCINSLGGMICQRNLLVVSSFSSVIPLWVWLVLVLLNFFGKN